MAPETQAGERYATQVGELWSGLSRTLVRLEWLASAPERLDDDETVEALKRLQYRLHIASESVVGLLPPADAEPAHSELSAALTGARDATGEVIEAVDLAGSRGVEAMLYEWRGALFRVRLARMRSTGPEKRSTREHPKLPKVHIPLIASVLTVGGVAAFAVGATMSLWPVWVVGVIAVCVSLLLYRP